jgi:hypothetical protein
MRPSMDDLSAPLLQRPARLSLGIDRCNSGADTMYGLRVASGQPIIGCHEHPDIELAVQLVKQLGISAAA